MQLREDFEMKLRDASLTVVSVKIDMGRADDGSINATEGQDTLNDFAAFQTNSLFFPAAEAILLRRCLLQLLSGED